MRFAAKLKRDLLRKTGELNDIIESKINSDDPEEMETVRNLKEEVQSIEDERDQAAARKYFAKVQLEGQKPSRFFYNLNKKRMEKAQFEELHIVEKQNEGPDVVRVVKEQKTVEWEVRKYYWNLYREQETNVDSEEILESIEEMKKVSLDDKSRLEWKITGEDVSITLKQTRNNVAPGPGHFGGSFYKVFWKFLKNIVINAINEI